MITGNTRSQWASDVFRLGSALAWASSRPVAGSPRHILLEVAVEHALGASHSHLLDLAEARGVAEQTVLRDVKRLVKAEYMHWASEPPLVALGPSPTAWPSPARVVHAAQENASLSASEVQALEVLSQRGQQRLPTSYADLASATDSSYDQARRFVKKLVDGRWVEKGYRRGGDGAAHAARLNLRLPCDDLA